MFKIIRRPKADGSKLLQSQLYDEKSFYKAFKRDLYHAQNMVMIESPYLTERRSKELVYIFKKLVNHGVEIRINTREPNHHSETLEHQAWKAIEILRESGVRIFLWSDMRHRKIAVIDGKILWEGSLNILSQASSKEVMRRTVSVNLCSQMVRFTKVNACLR